MSVYTITGNAAKFKHVYMYMYHYGYSIHVCTCTCNIHTLYTCTWYIGCFSHNYRIIRFRKQCGQDDCTVINGQFLERPWLMNDVHVMISMAHVLMSSINFSLRAIKVSRKSELPRGTKALYA